MAVRLTTFGAVDTVGNVRSRWFTAGAVKLHVVAAVSIAAMLGLFWWPLDRALAGNTLSWAGVDVIPTEDGLIKRKDVYSDSVSILRQLGFLD